MKSSSPTCDGICTGVSYDVESGYLKLRADFILPANTEMHSLTDIHLVLGRVVGDCIVVETPTDTQVEMPGYCLMTNDGVTPVAFFYDKRLANYVCNLLNQKP